MTTRPAIGSALALDNDIRILGLEVAEWETILAALDDPSAQASCSLSETLVNEHLAEANATGEQYGWWHGHLYRAAPDDRREAPCRDGRKQRSDRDR